ncbi:DotU family type IV/VI secretion system protein [Variovorax sp. J22R133]|uniref:DotU family type IV/VI secretion system protein n=1 Tax=Variovorax brevis TaxID=3053503 RepID=UPI0025766C36|nr:DotU family type IV/VI secretion system protein [Variovorax sp. J22R133]MDM0117215.1 DotU family type IV/VI secretion system protein [Variovorax sp. J22R133]
MTRLLDFFSPLIVFGLELDAATAAGQVRARTADNHKQALALIEQARAAAAAAGYGSKPIESASFAMVAWLDEVLARHNALHGDDDAEPLQQQLFNSRNAHSEFFHHLSALQARDDELREVYWHALALGFAGQYYFETGDQGELGKLKDLHGQQLQNTPLSFSNLERERITPQPYTVADPPLPRDPLHRERTMLRLGGALAALVPVLCLVWLTLATPRDAPSPMAQRIDHQLQSYACADLTTRVNSEGTLQVRGFVSRPEDIERVRREVAALPGVGAPQFDLGVRIWPHCEVVSILKPYQVRNRDKHFGLRVAVPSARDGQLREGDKVTLQLTNADFDGYIWVDYYTADGSVLHFFAGRGQARLGAREQIELGTDTPASWLVAPPFGTVMVTALASPAPFGDTTDRPPFEQASAYLLRLREMLGNNRAADRVAADYVFLQTVSR